MIVSLREFAVFFIFRDSDYDGPLNPHFVTSDLWSLICAVP